MKVVPSWSIVYLDFVRSTINRRDDILSGRKTYDTANPQIKDNDKARNAKDGNDTAT